MSDRLTGKDCVFICVLSSMCHSSLPLQARLEFLDNEKTRSEHLDEVILAANRVIGLVDARELALHFGVNVDEDDPKAVKRNSELDSKKGALVDALARKARAIDDSSATTAATAGQATAAPVASSSSSSSSAVAGEGATEEGDKKEAGGGATTTTSSSSSSTGGGESSTSGQEDEETFTSVLAELAKWTSVDQVEKEGMWDCSC